MLNISETVRDSNNELLTGTYVLLKFSIHFEWSWVT